MPAPRPSLRLASHLPASIAGVWHADALGAGTQRVLPTGYAALDAELPGGGWPVGALSEVLQPLAGLHEWQLVLPALVQATAQQSGAIVLVAPPCEPFGPALQSQGLRAERVLVGSRASAALPGRAGRHGLVAPGAACSTAAVATGGGPAAAIVVGVSFGGRLAAGAASAACVARPVAAASAGAGPARGCRRCPWHAGADPQAPGASAGAGTPPAGLPSAVGAGTGGAG